MPFSVKRETVSNRAWSDVDKSSLWQRFKKGLEEGVEGVREAIREIYAVLKAEASAELTQADCWGPHHELQQDGSVVLNKGGLVAAAGALAGARSDPDLTPAQRRQAARHLIRHYAEVEGLETPDSLKEAAAGGEMTRLAAGLSAMRPADIPLAPGVNLETLKAGDRDPLEVVVEIPAGKSTRGWNYLPETIQAIASQVARETATGFLGHQKPDDMSFEFPPPVTHWVGALWRDGKAYIRGVIDSAAADLKRWIRSGRVRQVSIFGVPTLRTAGGETQVVGYQLLSIDWTPLHRAGMPTAVVAMETIDSITGGDPPPVKLNPGGAEAMTLAELVAKLKELRISVRQLAGELGWKLEEVAGEIDHARWTQIQAGLKTMGEIAEVLGLGKEAKLEEFVAAVKRAHEAEVAQRKAGHDTLINKVVGEMVAAESVRPLVKRMLQVPETADEATVKKAVGELLESEDVKKALAAVFKDVILAPKDPNRDDKTPPSGVRTRRVAI